MAEFIWRLPLLGVQLMRGHVRGACARGLVLARVLRKPVVLL